MGKNTIVHKWKLWSLCLVIMCGILFFLPVVQTEASSKNSWSVKINNQYRGKIIRKGNEWYLQCTGVQMQKLKAAKRVAYMDVSSKSGFNSGYYYFCKDGRIDTRKKFHKLDTKIGTLRFKGSYYFGDASGRLWQKAGWITIKGKKLALNKNGKLYTNRWYKGYYLTANGTIATSQMVSEYVYVNEEGRKCAKEEVRLGNLKKKLQSTINGYSGSWSVYVEDLKTGDILSINETSMYPASVIKLFVMEAIYVSGSEKRISLNGTVKSLLNSMIKVSDNECYNELVRTLGIGSFSSGCNYINRYLKKQGYTGTGVHHSLHPSSSYYQNDGLGSNRSSAKDVGKLLKKIYKNKAVSRSCSRQMLNLLLNQERRYKIPAGLPSGVKSGNKTGETDNYQHDAAIVYGKKTDYVIVVFSMANEYTGINGIKEISSIVYNYLN